MIIIASVINAKGQGMFAVEGLEILGKIGMIEMIEEVSGRLRLLGKGEEDSSICSSTRCW